MKIKDIIKILKAFSDPSRLKLLKILVHKELCVCEIEEVMGMKQTTVSQQLRRLKEADIVIERKDGWWSYYSINKEKVDDFINSFKEFFECSIEDNNDFNDEYKRLCCLSECEKILKCKKL